jgi:glycosyltransferase involved in cell wall biosynthesis
MASDRAGGAGGVGAARPHRVVVIGPLPDPYNGMTVITQTILSSSLRERFDILHIDTSDHRRISNVGRLDVVNVFLALRAAGAVCRAVRRRDVAVVYLPVAKQRLAFIRDALFLSAARLSGLTTIVHLHARGFDEFRRSQPLWMRALIRMCLVSDRIHAIVLGECLRGEFDGLIPDHRVHVAPNGVPDHAAIIAPSGGVPTARPTVLHLSTLWGEKGVFDVLESARRLHRQIPGIRYVLAGGWYSAAELRNAERFIRTHGLTDCVRTLGPVGPEEKRRMLAEATVLALPSYSEGQPLVVLEALSAGVPVVTTRVGAIPEAIDDGEQGFLVEPGDVDALTDRIARLITEPKLRAGMSRSARTRYEHDFTAERFAGRLSGIWCSVAASTKPVPNQLADQPVGAVR